MMTRLKTVSAALILTFGGVVLIGLPPWIGDGERAHARLLQPRDQDRSLASWHPSVTSRVHEVFDENFRSRQGITDTRELSRHMLELCQKHQVEPSLVVSLIQVESNFQADAVSPKGAVGLLQVMFRTARAVGREENLPIQKREDLKNPFLNLSIGIAYFAQLCDHYGGSIPHALAAYNLGPGTVDQILERQGHAARKVIERNSYVRAVLALNDRF